MNSPVFCLIFSPGESARLRCASRGELEATPSARRALSMGPRLQRAQEVEDVLFLSLVQVIERADHRVRLGWAELLVAAARVSRDSRQEIRGPSVMEEEDPLPEPPEGGCAEL